MPALIKIAPTKKVIATIALEEATAKRVNLYAAFINATADDVVTQALDYVFAKDKDFVAFEAKPDGRTALQVLKLKGGADENKPRRTRKVAAKA